MQAFGADRMAPVKLGEGTGLVHWGNSSWTLLQLSPSAGELGESRLEGWAELGWVTESHEFHTEGLHSLVGSEDPRGMQTGWGDVSKAVSGGHTGSDI